MCLWPTPLWPSFPHCLGPQAARASRAHLKPAARVGSESGAGEENESEELRAAVEGSCEAPCCGQGTISNATILG